MAARRIVVLLTSAGRRVELLRCFRSAAAELDLALGVLCTDLDPSLSAACQDADASFSVPRSDDPGFVPALLDICRARNVGLLVPTIDPDLLPLAAADEQFRSAGVRLAVSSRALVEIVRDKLATAQFLSAHDIPAPRTLALEDVGGASGLQWPLLAKPRHGSAGRHIQIVHSPADLDAVPRSEPFIVQTLLRRPEFTVNLFFDAAGKLRCAVAHERLQVRAGEVEKGITRRIGQLGQIARQMAESLPGPRGALCFQAMTGREGGLQVTEINARFGGGYPLAHHAGANFARWLLEECAKLPSTASDAWREGITMLRFDAAVFLES